jgi:hypothetical protein
MERITIAPTGPRFAAGIHARAAIGPARWIWCGSRPTFQSCPAPWSQLRSSCWSPRLRPSPRAFDSPAVVLLAAVPPDCELPPCHIAACLGQRPRRPRLFGRLDTSCDQGVVTPPPILRERTIVVSRRAYVTTPLVGPPMPPPFTHGAPDFTTGRR